MSISKSHLAAMAAGLGLEPQTASALAGAITSETKLLGERNAALTELDRIARAFNTNPAEQMGVLMMAMILAMRRVLEVNGIHNRGARLRVFRKATEEFETKLRKYCSPEAAPPGSSTQV